MKDSAKKRPILVPIDFSETSKRGLESAARMALKLDARLVLFHVIEFHPAYYSPPVPDDWYNEEAIKTCNQTMRDLARRLVGDAVEVSTVVLIQPIAEAAIVEYAARIDAQMIVMGTHGRRGISHFFLGSTAENVVRHASCPVMTTGPHPADRQKAA